MAFLFADSFDFYATMTDAFLGVWDSGTLTALTVVTNTRFGVGQALDAFVQGAGVLVKSSGSNDAGHHLVMARKNATANGTATQVIDYFLLSDGVTGQVAICFMGDGAIQLRSGSSGGTTLASYAANLSLFTWYGIEFEVVINASTGSFAVRLNGAPANNFAATGLNTCPGGNVYANKLTYATGGAAPTNVVYDDLMWFSTGGAAPNTWVGDIRSVQQMPAANSAVALSASPASITSAPSAASSNTTSLSANNQVSSQVIVCATSGSCTTLTIKTNTAYTGNYKLGLYDATGTNGGPGTLLGETAQQTNATAATTVTVNLVSPVTVTAGTSYYGALITDSSFPASTFYNGNNIAYTAARTYGSDFLTTFGVAAANVTVPPFVTMTVAPSNFFVVKDTQQDGDSTFVYGATASTGDLYTLPTLATTPASIIAVQTRLLARKSDTAARTVRVQISSGGTLSNGGTVTLGSTYSYITKLDLVDPNTSAAWTGSAVNALLIGPYIIS